MMLDVGSRPYAVLEGPTVKRLVAAFSILAAATHAIAQDAQPAPSPLGAVMRMVEGGELDPAERELRDLLAQHDHPALRDLLGVVLSRQGRHEAAEREFAQALAADPELTGARQHLARLYLLQQRQDDAVQQLRQAARHEPLERDLAMTLAAVDLAAGDVTAAERQLRSVAERFGSVQALLELSRIATARGEMQASLETLQQAMEIAPASEEVLAANARTALAAGLPVPAIIALEPLVRMHPTVAEYAYLMGVARMQVADIPGSIEALRRALELEPNRASALIGLGLTLNHQKRHAEAREVLDRGLVLDPNNGDGLAALAEAEAGLSELESAEQHALRALAIGGPQATAHLALGLIRMQQGRYAEARDDLQAAVAADPKSTKAHYQLSLALARLGDRETSREHLEAYRRLLREDEEQLLELRKKVGLDVALADTGGTNP